MHEIIKKCPEQLENKKCTSVVYSMFDHVDVCLRTTWKENDIVACGYIDAVDFRLDKQRQTYTKL